MLPRAAVQSRTSTELRVMQREVVSDLPTVLAPVTIEKDPPPYGAQHRQDALWKGGNEALPPLWQECRVLHDKTRYVDNTLYMGSWIRPLPGVRLDQHGDLAPGCEWHISPLGRSYFVYHNTRTTAWKNLKPAPERSAGSLKPECIIKGHSGCIWALACLGTGFNIISTSVDGSIRQWTREGKPVGKPWNSSDGEVMGSIAVSPDGAMFVSGNVGDGRIRLWNTKESSVVGDPWEGHTAVVRCLDWSPNALEIASGSEDGTVRRWNPNTGRQVAPAIETGHGWIFVVKYSSQGDKFASCGMDKMIRVWSKNGELLNEIKGHSDSVTSLCWSKDSAHIFSGSASLDCTIRKWRLIDGEELLVLQGHTNRLTSLCLVPDESHIVSASRDCSIRIWDLKANKPVGDPLVHDDELCTLVMSPDGRYIASAGVDTKIYVWSLELLVALGGHPVDSARTVKADAMLKGRAAQSKNQAKNRMEKYGDDFWGNDTNHTPRRSPADPPSPRGQRKLFDFLGFSGSTPLATVPQPITSSPRRWTFRLPAVRPPTHSVHVASARDEDRYGITPPSEAEVAAAMQLTSGDSSTQQTQAAAGAQGPQVYMRGQPTQTTAQRSDSDTGTGEPPYVVGCCGFYVLRGRSSLH